MSSLPTVQNSHPSINPIIIAAAHEKKSPLYAIAVLTDMGCRIFNDTPPNQINHKNAADAIDYISQHPHANVLAHNGKYIIAALIATCRKFADSNRIASLITIAKKTANITVPLNTIFNTNKKHGPAFIPYPKSFVHWNTHPKRLINGLINEIACLHYLHSTTTPQGKLARLSAGANVDASFYKHWTKDHSQQIDYSSLSLDTKFTHAQD